MKYEIHNGEYVGTAEWRGPGRVELQMPAGKHRDFFESYLRVEDSTLFGPVEAAAMGPAERRDATEASFGHAMWRVAAYRYRARDRDAMQHRSEYSEESS